jgi:hypothetical protein
MQTREHAEPNAAPSSGSGIVAAISSPIEPFGRQFMGRSAICDLVLIREAVLKSDDQPLQ